MRDEVLIATTKSCAEEMNERNDCFVFAISLVLGVSYKKAWSVLKKFGRRRRCGTDLYVGILAIKHFGFRIENHVPSVEDREFVGAGKFILSRHFNEKNAEHFIKKYGNAFFAFSSGHAIPVINGIAHDWSYKKSQRIREIWTIKSLDKEFNS